MVGPPKEHPIYITGIFDLYGAEGCDQMKGKNDEADTISLPLAFVYAISTFKDRHPNLANLFDNVNIGAILFDACGDSHNLMEFLVWINTRIFPKI
jgi:hypothetical protein